jgi:universal stress protein E
MQDRAVRKILVLAGPHSTLAQPAIARAAALAENAGARIALLDVVYDPHLEGYLGDAECYARLRERIVRERQARLDGLCATLQARGLHCEAQAVWTHPAHMAVVREAAAPEVDLIVLEPQDAQGLSNDEWHLISVAPAPVLIVRDRAVRPYTAIVAAIDPVRGHDKPADLDTKILALAKSFRALFNARIEIVHCMPPLAAFVEDDTTSGSLRGAEAALRAQRERELGELLAAAQLPAEAGTLIPGKPTDILVKRSARGDAALLVLGTVQRGRIGRLLIGSTAERVLRAPGGDITVIKPAFVGGDTSRVPSDHGVR